MKLLELGPACLTDSSHVGKCVGSFKHVCALAQDEVDRVLGTSPRQEEPTHLLPIRGFWAENTQKEFREIPGRQRHPVSDEITRCLGKCPRWGPYP